MKRILDPKYRKLVNAGYLDGQLRITDAGRLALDHITLKSNLDELVTMAEDKIAREEKE